MNNDKQANKSFWKILLINLISFIILFHVADFCAMQIDPKYKFIFRDYNGNKLLLYIKEYKNTHNFNMYFNTEDAYDSILDLPYSKKNEERSLGVFRPIENTNANKSIIIFGCSYAYGWKLDNNETFSYLLGQYLPNYRIYNRAHPSWTTSSMLYQLENGDFSEIPNVKYLLYVFMPEHFYRDKNMVDGNILIPFYSFKKNQLVLSRFSFRYMDFPLYVLFKDVEKYFFFDKKVKQNEKISKSKLLLTKEFFKASKKEAEILFGTNVKFIILAYGAGRYVSYNYIFEDLKKEGFIVVSLKDLSDTEYCNLIKYQISEADAHPNALLWQEITPLFVKYLQNRGYFKD